MFLIFDCLGLHKFNSDEDKMSQFATCKTNNYGDYQAQMQLLDYETDNQMLSIPDEMKLFNQIQDTWTSKDAKCKDVK